MAEFSESRFWEKIAAVGKVAGCKVLCLALQLFYAYLSPDTPKWAKAAIVGALAYFILPLDAVPDFIPGLGYTDDLGVLAGALKAVHGSVTDPIRDRASEKVKEWLGQDCNCYS